MIDLRARWLREVLFWLPNEFELELSGALFERGASSPVDLQFWARRAGAFCLEGPIGSAHGAQMQGSGQLVWAGGEAQLRVHLARPAAPFSAWCGVTGQALRVGLPAGAEFTGSCNGRADQQLTLRLDYRGLLRRLRTRAGFAASGLSHT